jgi:hypothetical protein
MATGGKWQGLTFLARCVCFSARFTRGLGNAMKVVKTKPILPSNDQECCPHCSEATECVVNMVTEEWEKWSSGYLIKFARSASRHRCLVHALLYLVRSAYLQSRICEWRLPCPDKQLRLWIDNAKRRDPQDWPHSDTYDHLSLTLPPYTCYSNASELT